MASRMESWMVSAVAGPEATLPWNGEASGARRVGEGSRVMVVEDEGESMLGEVLVAGRGAALSCAAAGSESETVMAAMSALRAQEGSTDKTCIGVCLLTHGVRWRERLRCLQGRGASRFV